VLDNLSAHSTPEIAKWLAHKDRRRWHLHYTPTSSSWLNLIERWFKELTDKRLRRVSSLPGAMRVPNSGTIRPTSPAGGRTRASRAP
jgi:transposase